MVMQCDGCGCIGTPEEVEGMEYYEALDSFPERFMVKAGSCYTCSTHSLKINPLGNTDAVLMFNNLVYDLFQRGWRLKTDIDKWGKCTNRRMLCPECAKKEKGLNKDES